MKANYQCTACNDIFTGLPSKPPACPSCNIEHSMRTLLDPYKAPETPLEQLNLWPMPTTWKEEPLKNAVREAYAAAYRIWCDRQAKYGPSNIAITGALGCYVRSQDKLARLSMVYKNGTKDTPDESIEDSWLDLLNYAMMGYLCHKGQWPKE